MTLKFDQENAEINIHISIPPGTDLPPYKGENGEIVESP